MNVTPESVIIWICVSVFAVLALISILALVGVITIPKPYKNALFTVLLLDVAAGGVAIWNNYIPEEMRVQSDTRDFFVGVPGPQWLEDLPGYQSAPPERYEIPFGREFVVRPAANELFMVSYQLKDQQGSLWTNYQDVIGSPGNDSLKKSAAMARYKEAVSPPRFIHDRTVRAHEVVRGPANVVIYAGHFNVTDRKAR